MAIDIRKAVGSGDQSEKLFYPFIFGIGHLTKSYNLMGRGTSGIRVQPRVSNSEIIGFQAP
jgi:hypothetical protein